MNYRHVITFLAMTLGLASGAGAAEQSWTVTGHALKIVSPCAKLVTIEPTARTQDMIEVTATAEHSEEIDRLTVTEGATIARNSSHCASVGGALNIGPIALGVVGKQTLQLTVRVPAGIAIDLQDNGSGDYQIGAIGGPLSVMLHGSGDVKAVKISDLTLSMFGSGDAHIDEVAGKIDGRMRGSGDLKIDKAMASATALELSGSGSATIALGNVGALSATLRGSGNLRAPDCSGLQLTTSGSSNVTLHRLDGSAGVSLSGSGNLTVGEINATNVVLRANSHSDIKLGSGHINSLALESHGSGDLVVDAVVDDAALNLTGSGDVTIHHVTGHLVQSSKGSGKITVDRQ